MENKVTSHLYVHTHTRVHTCTNTYTIPHKAAKLCGLITEKESNKVGKFCVVYWP